MITITTIATIVMVTAAETMAQALLKSAAHLSAAMGVCHPSGAGGLKVDWLKLGLGRKERNTTSLMKISNAVSGSNPAAKKTTEQTAIT